MVCITTDEFKYALHPFFSNEFRKDFCCFSPNLKKYLSLQTKEMLYHAYDNYMRHAFPFDELNPIYCNGRGPDYNDAYNLNINDVLGNYSLTLIDSLDTLAVIGDVKRFQDAVKFVKDTVSFNSNVTVQVFEVNIRILGALLSAHLLIMDDSKPFGPLKPDWYNNELLEMAKDLGSRLKPAFEESKFHIPYPRINLKSKKPKKFYSTTCLAGAGTYLLEFIILSELVGDEDYKSYAKHGIDVLWKMRSNKTGLFGSELNVETGKWTQPISSLGAGSDSFYEYLLKAYTMFGDVSYFDMFHKTYQNILLYQQKGRLKCHSGPGFHPIFANVNMNNGKIANSAIDSLMASFAAVQVLYGDVDNAICTHMYYYFLWKTFNFLPERYNWNDDVVTVFYYPLRPEFAESTYYLYRATKNPFYLHVGKLILDNLNKYTKTKCGFGTIHNVYYKTLEDRMESFFISETLKYLYLLFDEDNYINKNFMDFTFSTEGHIFKNDERFFTSNIYKSSSQTCPNVEFTRKYGLPMREIDVRQLFENI